MDTDLVRDYSAYGESIRLVRDNTHRLEWITTAAVLAENVSPGAPIPDARAGTGACAFH